MKKARWSESETANLAAHYPAINTERLRALLTTRTEQAIRTKAHHMGIHKMHERLRESGRENVLRRYVPPIET